jgi:hypothetical protein
MTIESPNSDSRTLAWLSTVKRLRLTMEENPTPALERDKHLCQPCLRNNRETPAEDETTSFRFVLHLSADWISPISSPSAALKVAKHGR